MAESALVSVLARTNEKGNLGDTLCRFPKWTRGSGRSTSAGPLSPPPAEAGRHLLLLWSSVLMTEGSEEAAETFGPFLITTDTMVQEVVAGATGPCALPSVSREITHRSEPGNQQNPM